MDGFTPGPQTILFLDEFDEQKPLHEWLRTRLLPDLAIFGFVFASRFEPTLGRGLLAADHILALKGLSPSAGAHLLEREHSPVPFEPSELAEISRRWSGHPLALQLLRFAGEGPNVTHTRAPEITDALYQLARCSAVDFPSDAHARGLRAAALVPNIDFHMLQELTAAPDISPIIAWLQALSFVDVRSGRVNMHRVPAGAIVRELSVRDPDALGTLASEALMAIAGRLDTINLPEDCASAGRQAFHIGEHHPTLRPLYCSGSELRVELVASQKGRQEFTQFAKAHHGKNATIYQEWLHHGSDLWCARDPNGELHSATLVAFIDEKDDVGAHFDPFVRQLHEHMTPTLAKSRTMIHRAMIDVEAGAPGPAMQSCMEVLHTNHQCLPKKDIGHSFVILPAAGPWFEVGKMVADFTHTFDFHHGGRSWPVVHRDMSEGSGQWLRQIAQSLGESSLRLSTPAPDSSAPVHSTTGEGGKAKSS